MRTKTAALLVALVMTCAGAHARAEYGSFDRQASSVWTAYVWLYSGTQYTFETANLTQGSDTVMHLWKGVVGFSGGEMDMNDDYGGDVRSRIVFTPIDDGIYLVVVRSYANGYDGQCDVKLDGANLAQGVYFGGLHFDVNTQATDVVQTALQTGGTDDTVFFGFGASPHHLLAIDDDSGVGYASKVTGSFTKVVMSTFGGGAPGDATIVVNDAGSDSDGDGLGTQLESALCICDTVSTSPCGIACDYVGMRTPQDSDGDGIRDDWEVLGRDEDPTDANDFPQHLPKWGANPMQKDLFVEMDWDDASGAGAPLLGSAAQDFAAAYNASGTAGSLHNRDGSDGIRVHIDSGVSTTGTIYGDWGGATSVSAPNYDNPSYADFVRSRRGVFKYGIGIPAGMTGHGSLTLKGFEAAHDNGVHCAHDRRHRERGPEGRG